MRLLTRISYPLRPNRIAGQAREARQEILPTSRGLCRDIKGRALGWFEYRLEHHPEFLRRIEDARVALRAGQGIPLREVG